MESRKKGEEDIVTKNLITLNEDTPILNKINVLERNKLIRVPVASNSGLVGILTHRDVLFCYIRAPVNGMVR